MTPDIIEQVALVTGRIIHEGTGEPIFGHVRITVGEGRVVDKMLRDGTFVISGRPETLFPNLALQPYLLTLDIRAASPQYREGFIEQSRTVAIPAGASFDPPIAAGTIALPADPVNIRGSVVEARDLTIPAEVVTHRLLLLDGSHFPGSIRWGQPLKPSVYNDLKNCPVAKTYTRL